MFSVIENKQVFPSFDYWDFQVEFRINKELRSFNIQNMSQIFMGEKISLKKAIKQKSMLQCFIDLGEKLGGTFHNVGSVSFTWDPEQNECYIGNLWIEPEFRGNGIGTYILNEIINFTDELGVVLTLHAIPFISPEEKPTIEDILRLKDFYRRFGFRENYQTKGLDFCGSMSRKPRIRYHYQNN